MNKQVSFFIVLLTIMLTLASILFNIQNVEAVNAENSDYSIEQVNHTVEVMCNGYIFINDTIQVTGQISNGFLIGFLNSWAFYLLTSPFIYF